METILPAVLAFAFRAHGDQERKFESGPFIIHPLRVMHICKQYTADYTVLSGALLHDVLEDTATKTHELEDFLISVFSPADAIHVLDLVKELTDQYTSKAYPELNRRQRKRKEAERMENCRPNSQTIKYADIIDNSITVINADNDFGEKYLHECRYLLHRISKGDPQLYERAIGTVEEGLKRISNR